MKMPTVTIENNEKIYYEDIGEGTPILCIHPPGMGRKVFYEQKPLSNKFRLILPDLAGHGDSTYDEQSDISISRYSEDIIQLLDKLKIKETVILGYSAGGTIAQQICIDYPSRVKALIMSGGYPIVDNLPFINIHKVGILVVEKNKKFVSDVLAFSHTRDKHYRKVLAQHMYKAHPAVWKKYYIESLQFNCKEQIKGLTIPTLILYGSKSDYINTYIKFYKENIPRHQIHVIQGVSHQVPTKKPEQLNRIITDVLLKLEHQFS
jgi:pimeloyl-ACP methyl ester carboxylesterase